MENKMMNAVKNMALGAVVGAAALTAGAVYANENKMMKKTTKDIKRTGRKIVKAGQDAMDDMMK